MSHQHTLVPFKTSSQGYRYECIGCGTPFHRKPAGARMASVEQLATRAVEQRDRYLNEKTFGVPNPSTPRRLRSLKVVKPRKGRAA
jgi:hypothetical protein